ncbi:MAG: tetratricopeptide repeat protein [Rhizomicrobium sp.]|jgi:tetratricopeptide (TPR) repeat protein
MHVSRMAALAFAIGAVAFVGARGETGAATAKARLLMNSGIAHERLGQHEDALADFTAALKLKTLSPPDRVRAIFDRGVALDALGRTKDAIRDYSEAIRLGPRFAPALSNRANAYRRLGRLAEAKRDYLAAIAAGEAAREYPYYGLAQIADRLGDIDTARDYYSKALAANPGYALAAQSLAALNQSQRATIVLRPPLARQAPTNNQAETTSVKPASFVHLPPPPKRPTPKPEPVRIAAREAAEPPLRQAIVEGGAHQAHDSPMAQIQLGAFRDQAAATEGWNKILAASDGVLQGKSPLVVPVDLPGKGRLWRLRVAAGDKSSARRLCAALVAKGLACVVVRD